MNERNRGATPEVTVVVPARNEEEHIAACLASILDQSHADFEVLVVDGASTDRTREIVRKMSERDDRIRLLHNPDKVIPRSLNLAVREARGRYLVRIDAHATVNPEYISILVGHLRTGRWGGVGGRKDGVGYTSAGRAIAAALGSRFGVGGSVYHHGTDVREVDHIPFGAYPIDVVRELGGWDERLLVNQDFEFDYRIRLSSRRLLFDPAARIDWLSRQSIRSFFRQYFRYGSGKTAVLRLHPASMSPRHLMAPALVGALTVSALMLPVWPFVSVVLTLPYLMTLIGASMATGRGLPDWSSRLHLPLAFIAMHLGWGIGFLWGVVRRDEVNASARAAAHHAE